MKGMLIALVCVTALISGCATHTHYGGPIPTQVIVPPVPAPVVVYNYPCDHFPTWRARQECKRSYERQMDYEARRVGREHARRGY